jgi:hypothetical protein
MFNRFVYFLILGFFSINHLTAEKPIFDNGDSIQVDVAENNKSVATIKATDPGGTRIKYNLQNSYGDSRLFSINSSSGVLTFKDSADYENPLDANNDNIYVARVRARNATKEQSFQIINVYIQDVNDNHPVISNAFTKKTIDENHLFVNQMKGSDADESDALSWSLDPTFSDNSLFTIGSSTGRIFFRDIPDFENPINSNNLYNIKVQLSDGQNTVTTDGMKVKVRNRPQRSISLTVNPETYIVMDGSTPTNLMYSFENSFDWSYWTGEPIDYSAKKLNEDLSYGSYEYTLVSGFVGYWKDNSFGSNNEMTNSYDDYLVETSSNDDALFIRLEQPKANPDCGLNDFNSSQPLCSVWLEIYRYDNDFESYSIWKMITNDNKNKTLKLPVGNKKYLIRVVSSSEMSNSQGNSPYYLYAYRAGNTPSKVLGAFAMANRDNNDSYNWFQPDLDLSKADDIEFSKDRILVYNKNLRTKKHLTFREDFSKIIQIADEEILSKKGFSVIELNDYLFDKLSLPANRIIESTRELTNSDTVNGDQPKNPLILSGNSKSDSIQNIVATLSKIYPDNEFSLDYKVHSHNFNYDPDYIRYQKEYFDLINAEQGLTSIGTGADVSDVIVAVIDSGSPSKNSRAWNSSNWVDGEFDFVSNDFDSTDPSATMEYPENGSHGTHVATTIAAKNDKKNINGFGLKVLPLRALDENGSGYYSWICNAIAYAGQVSNDTGETAPVKADLINMSLGGGSSCPCQEVINDVYDNGVTIIASAGNGYVDENNYPASCDNVLSVSSIGSTGEKAYYSSFGEKVDISAPGGDRYLDIDNDGDWDGIWAFTKDNKLELYQGTSMAAPIASAVIGNVIAKDSSATPNYIYGLVKKRLILSDKGNTGFDRVYGYGMVDLQKVANLQKQSVNLVTTFAEINQGTVNLHDSSSATVSVNRNGKGGSLRIQNPSSSHPGITVSSLDVNAKGFGSYQISIDQSMFNNSGRLKEYVSFEARDKYVTDIIRHPVIFQIGNGSDSRSPANISRMMLINEISSANELLQNINDQVVRIEGNSSVSYQLEDARYRRYLSTDMDFDFFVCDFGEICWYDDTEVSSRQDISVVLNGNNLIEVSANKQHISKGKKYWP